MDNDIKAEWLKRLRSNEYQQGTKGHLCVIEPDGTKKYCCLGVLAEIAVEHGVIRSAEHTADLIPDSDPETQSAIVLGFDGESEFPSEKVRIWAGLPPEPDNDGIQYTLSVMNDGDPTDETENPRNSKSFAEIANFIEENA